MAENRSKFDLSMTFAPDLMCENLLVRGELLTAGPVTFLTPPTLTVANLTVNSTLVVGDNAILGNATTDVVTVSGVVNENGWTTLTQPAAQVVTNAADQNSDTFFFPATVAGGVAYAIELELFVAGSDAAGDFEFRFAADAGLIFGRGAAMSIGAADTVAPTLINVNGAGTTPQVPVGTFADINVPIAVTAAFAFKTSITTTFRLQFGNLVPGAGRQSKICGGSRMRWRAIGL